MQKSYLLLCLLCIPMAMTASENGAGIVLPLNSPQQILASTTITADVFCNAATIIAKAIRQDGPKTFGEKCIKIGQEAAWEGTKMVMVAAVMLIAESIRRKYIVDLVKNEDWDTHSRIEAAATKQYEFCIARIKELTGQQANGLTPEQESRLAQYKEDASRLEEDLAKSRQETIKRLPKTLEHGGTMFNHVMYPLAKLLPS